ncbi:glycosyltransferase family 2 protein [Sulfurimonas sp. HSL1-2]|uniref:glycosyltransferase family 2 protein n=1 Tax=Thiomicrolovo zhangzhouensis TaxID=3131933 RepID=UPI0031F75151
MKEMLHSFRYSIVIPVYNSASFVTKTVHQIIEETEKAHLVAEIILVNDGSSDGSWDVIKGLARELPNVKSINLIKNFGQHSAILCGFEHASGLYVITMDDDLQNPPSEIVKLTNAIEKSEFDLVFGKFTEKKHANYRKLGSKVIGYLNRKIFNKPDHIVLSNFRIIHRDVIDRLLSHKTAYPYIPGLLLLYATNIGNVEVEHHERIEGKSNYTFKRIVSLVSRLLINYSSYPLRLLSMIGLIISGASFLLGVVYLLLGLFGYVNVPGWTTMVVLTSFLGGFIIAMLGIIGEYLSRILDQLSSERSYYVREIVE